MTRQQLNMVLLNIFVDWLPLSFTWAYYLETAKNLGLSTEHIGFLLATGGVGQYIGAKLLTKKARKYDKRAAAALAWVPATIVSVLFAIWSNSAYLLFSVVFFVGFCAYSPALISSYAGAYTEKTKRTKAYALITMSLGISVFVGPLIFAFTAKHFIGSSQLTNTICLVGLCLLSILVKWFLTPAIEQVEICEKTNKAIKPVWSKNAKKYILTFVMMSLIGNSLGWYYPMYLREIHQDVTILAWLFSFIGATSLMAPVLALVVTKKITEHAWVLSCMVGTLVSVVWCSATNNLYAGACAYLFWALAGDCAGPVLQSMLTKEFTPDTQLVVAKAKSDVSSIGGIIGSIFGGMAFAYFGVGLFWSTVVLAIIAIVLVAGAKEKSISAQNYVKA